jgi:multidrug transporter EmrE-like cation transporter
MTLAYGAVLNGVTQHFAGDVLGHVVPTMAWTADAGGLAVAAMIAAIVVTATAGDVLTASAMRRIGDLDEIRARSGLKGAIIAVVKNVRFLAGVLCMALSFFSLLFALSHADVSLVAPASASLTFVSNAVAAKFFLKENVDRRRWTAAVFVCVGVALLVH